MAKKIKRLVKIHIDGGKATPAPPVGTLLGPTGINIGDFCSQFNEKTKDKQGIKTPALISIYEDRTFSFILKTPPASFLLKKAAQIQKGSSKNLVKRAGTVKMNDVKEIAEQKMEDLNARDIDEAVKIISGTARSMGIKIEE